MAQPGPSIIAKPPSILISAAPQIPGIAAYALDTVAARARYVPNDAQRDLLRALEASETPVLFGKWCGATTSLGWFALAAAELVPDTTVWICDGQCRGEGADFFRRIRVFLAPFTLRAIDVLTIKLINGSVLQWVPPNDTRLTTSSEKTLRIVVTHAPASMTSTA